MDSGNQEYLIIDLNKWAHLDPRMDRLDITLERFMNSNEARPHLNISTRDRTSGTCQTRALECFKVISTWEGSEFDEKIRENGTYY